MESLQKGPLLHIRIAIFSLAFRGGFVAIYMPPFLEQHIKNYRRYVNSLVRSQLFIHCILYEVRYGCINRQARF